MRKHFIRLLVPARVMAVLRTPDDSIMPVNEGEKLRLVDGLGVAEDLTDEFEPEYFPAEEGAEGEPDAEPVAADAAPATETPKPRAARKPRKMKG